MDSNPKLTAHPKDRDVAFRTLGELTFVLWLLGIFFFELPIARTSVVASAPVQAQSSLLQDAPALLLMVIAALVLMYFLRKKKFVAPVVSVMMGLLVFSSLSVFVGPAVAFCASALLVFVERAYRSFLANDLFVFAGVFAAAASFAASYQTDFLLTLLWIFATYDLIGVFGTRLIPKVAFGAVATGVPLLLCAPKADARWRDTPSLDTTAAVIGAGDLFLPLMFLMSVSAQFGPVRALWCFLGAAIGSYANLHAAKMIKTGIPAMPLLTAGIAVAYFLTK